jgi:hypothetical protein
VTRVRSTSSTPRTIPGHTVAPGEVVEVPDELAAGLLEQPDRWRPADETSPPPRSGRGSGRKAWAAHAAAIGVVVPDGASRDEIIAACAAAEQQE